MLVLRPKTRMNPVDPPALSRVWFDRTRPRKRDERKAQMGIELKVGEKAPAFSLPRDGGGMVSLAQFKGRKLVIYFYPRADTPGCTRESIDFSRLRATFDQAGTDILGVSADPVKAQDAFKKKHDLTIGLLSDETHKMLEAYGAWGKKSMYGKSFTGVLRTTFLIGPDGRIAQIWPKVKVEGHAAEVLKAAKAL
jgi:peroxiredoxin Q/BCP